MEARQRPGGAGCVGDGDPRRHAEIFFQPGRQIGKQRFLAAKQMRGSLDVEEKTVGAVFRAPRRSGRRITRRPQRQPAQRGIVGCAIKGVDLQVAGLGARIGQRLAEYEA